jgi:hypothetical protein
MRLEQEAGKGAAGRGDGDGRDDTASTSRTALRTQTPSSRQKPNSCETLVAMSMPGEHGLRVRRQPGTLGAGDTYEGDDSDASKGNGEAEPP